MFLVKMSEMRFTSLFITVALLYTLIPLLTVAGGPGPEDIGSAAKFQKID